jgi:hypothetical protein
MSQGKRGVCRERKEDRKRGCFLTVNIRLTSAKAKKVALRRSRSRRKIRFKSKKMGRDTGRMSLPAIVRASYVSYFSYHIPHSILILHTSDSIKRRYLDQKGLRLGLGFKLIF